MTNIERENEEIAILGAGCFWGVDEILSEVDGVLSTVVGYAGGAVVDPGYEDVCTGTTGHAEVVKIAFDPTRLSYADLLDYFFRLHDPTTLNRQANDTGTQYRSVIFYESEEQKRTAEQIIARLNDTDTFANPIVTEVTPATTFYSAEARHQDYLLNNPGGYRCHILRPPS